MEFARDVWAELTGEDLKMRFGAIMSREFNLRDTLKAFKKFKQLDEPVNPCLVYATQHGKDPHMGVYFNSSVLHLRPTGPEFLPVELAMRGFTNIRFYK